MSYYFPVVVDPNQNKMTNLFQVMSLLEQNELGVNFELSQRPRDIQRNVMMTASNSFLTGGTRAPLLTGPF